MSADIKEKKLLFTKINKKGEVEEVRLGKISPRKREWLNIPPAYFNLGMYLAIPLLLAVFVGQYLDRRFGTKALFTLILIIFGTISVFYNLIRLYKDDGTTHKH